MVLSQQPQQTPGMSGSTTMFNRILQGALIVALSVWTVYWLRSGHAYLHEHSIVMQQGFGGDGVQMWEIFNIKMVAAHQALRWLAGFAPGALLLVLLRRRRAAVKATAAAADLAAAGS
jgi:hypothetical protein